MDEKDESSFGFDLLDPTKIIPEDLVSVMKLGKMQLNRNPRNYFAETEQIMVCSPGISSMFLPISVDGFIPDVPSTVPTRAHCSWNRLHR